MERVVDGIIDDWSFEFPLTFALAGWFGFLFDLFDSTYPDSLLIS